MQDETTAAPPLKQAISAMRNALDAAIGEELDRLLTGSSQTVPTGDGQDHVARERESVAGSPPPVREGVEPIAQTAPRPSSPTSAATSRPNPSTTIAPESSDANDSDAVERRLDALALRLEGRLRRARDRDPHRSRSDEDNSPHRTDPEREPRT
ncbi:hypothetical protein [Tautonia marina]|uniref:hypothetical protein n=1 Tax=Tautonia marina TaxID=2653855 RepID=UPI001260F902|nr:hypothetical protein [Tautonia marina]